VQDQNGRFLRLAAVDLLEFGLRVGAADSVNGQVVLALKFLNGGIEVGVRVAVDRSTEIS
jgi:hypothetical protein